MLDEPSGSNFCKWHIDPKNIDTLNNVPPDNEDAVRDMLLKYERIWAVQLGEMKGTVEDLPQTRHQAAQVSTVLGRPENPRTGAIGD